MQQQQQHTSASQRTRDINERLYARNIPSGPLQPYLDARSVSTKYSVFPVIDYRRPVSVKLHQEPTFTTTKMFNPGNNVSPWSGFATQVNTESILRNQVYANQKCSAAVYIPSSKSDLYKIHWTNYNANTKLVEHPYLFEESQFPPSNSHPDAPHIGGALFNNSTRTQLNDYY